MDGGIRLESGILHTSILLHQILEIMMIMQTHDMTQHHGGLYALCHGISIGISIA